MTPWPEMDDDGLLAALGEAVAEADADPDAVTERRRAAARAAFAWRSVDVELADLLHDSALEPGGVRSATDALDAVRTLSYGAGDLTLELEVDGDDVTGQVVGPGAATVTLRRADGTETTADVDPSGFFTIAGVAPGPARFVAGPLTTPWVTL